MRGSQSLRLSTVAAVIVMIIGLGSASRATAGPTFEEAVRFLQQATFGPTPELVARVQAVGFDAFLTEQLAIPAPVFPQLDNWPQNPPNTCTGNCVRDNYSMYPLQVGAFRAFLTSPDQVRLRVTFALNQIFVVSAVDGNLRQPSRMLPYLQVLSNGAFGSFRQLLTDITLNPAMARYLDTANNNRASPNENYARELLQLFSIGVNQLNPDGTLQLDSAGEAIPTYDQTTITAFARVFTGWVFAPARLPGVTNYIDPLAPGAASTHDTQPKTLLNGVTLPGGHDAATDLHDALDNVFAHPNVGPFIGKQLIQHLVTSNPSPAYVGRVAAVFRSTGGDMKSVVRAILLDPEARTDPASGPPGDATYGHLREPVLWITSFLRPFGARVVTDYVLSDSFLPSGLQMGQDLFRAPSVFNFYPPDYVVMGDSTLGPEFAIYSTSTTLARTNFAYQVIYKTMSTNANRPVGTWIDLSGLESMASDPAGVVDALNAFYLHGRMTIEMRNAVIASVTAIPASNPIGRLRNALYLVVTSPQYLIER
jgi:uncharacterized protein (DUF1800 family)